MKRVQLVAATLVVFGVSCGATLAVPKPPPPRVQGGVQDPPPPAWIETKGGQFWLEFSDFCWFTACASYKPPRLRTDLPRIVLKRGETAKFHFRFKPKKLILEVGSKRITLAPKQVATWRVQTAGVASLEAFGGLGRVAYVARFRLK